MKQNQSLNHTGQVKNGPADTKFGLFSSSSDAWILAIVLLILLFLSFISEQHTFQSSLKQIQDQSENNILTKKLSTAIYSVMADEKTGIISNKNAGREINKDFFWVRLVRSF